MEKKTTKKPAAKKDEGEEKAKKAPAKKAAAPKAKKAAKPDVEGVSRAAAEVRSKQEENSIAPPSSNLVSAFAMFKKKNVSTASPTVTRLAAGASLPKPPAPKVVPPPPPAAPAAPAAPTPVAGPAAPVAPKPPVPGAPALPPRPASPGLPPGMPPVRPAGSPPPAAAAPAAPAAPKTPAPLPPGMPAVRPAVPGAPAKPGVPPTSVPPKPVVLRPGAITTRPPSQTPSRPAPRPGQPGYRGPGQPHRPGGRPQHQNRPSQPSAPQKPVEAGGKSALKKIQVSSMITVRELSEKMEVKTNDVIKKLMSLGIFATINQRLETEAAQVVAADFGYELEVVAMYKEEELAVTTKEKEDPTKLKGRPPVVTIMGHVDHGKTSLLDAIRSSRVAEGESGGITQHIGAYQVRLPDGQAVTFLDTPGHAAFSQMRARGAKVTDLVILVVSATDGIMPQTLEAIDHAKAAGVPVVVAVNKIDLPGANPQKIRQDLANHGLQPEEWGGKNMFVDVSAKKRLNLDKLLEGVLLQAEILELKANPDRLAYGTVIEAKMDPKRGSVSTVLVQAGTLKVGDAFVAGLAYGKIKALVNDRGDRLELAGPSTPVEILGLTGSPQAGDAFTVVENEKAARDIAEKRRLIHREQTMAHQKHMTLVGLRSALTSGSSKAKDLNIVLKADTQGSLQALRDSLEGMATTECRVRVIHGGIGNASESDVLLASASDAVVLMFHSEAEPRATEVASRDGVEIRKYEIIYDLIEDVKAALEGLLAPEIVDVIVGKGEVKATFAVKGGNIAGTAIRDGKVTRGGFMRVMRGGEKIHEGKVATLKHFKDDVKEMDKGQECGIGIDGFGDFQVGDLLEFFVKETRTRRLSSSPR